MLMLILLLLLILIQILILTLILILVRKLQRPFQKWEGPAKGLGGDLFLNVYIHLHLYT